MSKLPSNGSMRDAAKAALAEKEPQTEYVDMTTGEIMAGAAKGAAVALPVDETDEDLFYNPAYAEFDVVRQVTIPVLKWQAGLSIVCQVTSPFKLGKDISSVTKMLPPHLTVAKILTQRGNTALRTLIIGAVLKEELEGQYPNESYVGRWFTMRKLAREKFINQLGEMTEKRYSLYQVLEITDPTVLGIKAPREPRALPASSPNAAGEIV